MRNFTFLFLLLTFIIGGAVAQTSDNKWAIGLGPGLDYNMEIEETNFLADFYVSRYLSSSFDLMLDNRVSWWSEGVDMTVSLLNLRYKLSNGYIFKEDSKIQPYLFGGVGYLWDNQSNGVTFDGGLGFKFPISERVSLFVAGSYVKGIDGQRYVAGTSGKQDVNDDHLQLTSIIEFSLGKAKDSDGDGVPDRKDECPDTPPGVQVDEKGCPLDRDGDGVPDYKDDCPDEPGLAKFNGCPDRDGDGVPDKDDECPDVPGLAKFNGCPDSDEDGVPDHKDKCPDTPKGCPVDADGCPLDSDGDGVIDCEDDCPTVPGPASNKGCPDWQTLEIPAIYFDLNKAILKEEGKVELDKLASELNASKEFELVISGHTCSVGTEEYNMGLSQKRAEAVVKYLLSKGVNNAYVGSNNYGETKPAVANDTRAHRKLNRRAEFEVAKVRK
ncbi:OmpA family protein [Prolixibacteraceae bacterium Z1-6]|uniref:OmpA family protein n=1 Tax=Draconibacterium aestuarii TaxID=2998507 RepID=A0A9X3J410_9BACT|nr:OmpA family protein [Prolixibacteraceae bacterium Z1-6]